MGRPKCLEPHTYVCLRAPTRLLDAVDAIALIELRTKTAVLTLALEEYAERHHPELFKQYKGASK